MFRTAPDLAEPLQSALTRHRRLLRAAMKVLCEVALHQPATRPEIEAIRGGGQATMDLLMETGVITAHGCRQVPSTPTLWVTTPRFLAVAFPGSCDGPRQDGCRRPTIAP